MKIKNLNMNINVFQIFPVNVSFWWLYSGVIIWLWFKNQSKYTTTVVYLFWFFKLKISKRQRFTSRGILGISPLLSERLQNLDLRSALMNSEQGGIFVVPYLLWHGDSVHTAASLVISYTCDKPGVLRTYSNPDGQNSKRHSTRWPIWPTKKPQHSC